MSEMQKSVDPLVFKNQPENKAVLSRLVQWFSWFFSTEQVPRIKTPLNMTPDKLIALSGEIVPLDPVALKAEQFLKTENYDLFFQMLAHGYQPSQEQRRKFTDYQATLFYDIPVNQYDTDSIENWKKVEKYLTLNPFESGVIDTVIFKILKMESSFIHFQATEDTANKIQDENKAHAFPLITQLLKSRLNEPHYSKKIFNQINQYLVFNEYRSEERTDHYLLLKHNAPYILSEVNFEEFMSFIEKARRIYEAVGKRHVNKLDYLNDIMNKHYSADISEFMKQVKRQYGTQFVQTLTMHEIRESHFTLNHLPESAQNILNEINDFYQKIQAQGQKISEEQLFMVQKIFEKRLPEVLKKYLTIDEEYRQSLTNSQGKNAQELMLESLANIRDSFKSHWQEVNQDNVHELSALNRYTQLIDKA